jgi:aspartyl-tRNA(Asn)/glutamyl-tRNA(Gln) amidotransferase subunit A
MVQDSIPGSGAMEGGGAYNRHSRIPAGGIIFALAPLESLSAADCAVIGSVIAGVDPLDPTTSGAPAWDMAATQRTPKGMTIGVPRKFYVDDLEFDRCPAWGSIQAPRANLSKVAERSGPAARSR